MENDNRMVDTRGYSCPVPLALTSRNIRHINEGDVALILFDDESFKKDIEIWCSETGNTLLEFIQEPDHRIARVRKGSGYKSKSLYVWLKFILLGVRLHLVKLLIRLLRIRKVNYLITFVSIAEGVRSDSWLESKRIRDYNMLPVPADITAHCGIVFGVKDRPAAKHIFRLLSDNGFGVEDIYRVGGEAGVSLDDQQ